MKKRVLLVIGLVLSLFLITGCGKKEIKADTKAIESKARMMMALLESADINGLKDFQDSSDFLKQSQVAQLTSMDANGNYISLNDTKIEDFEGVVDAWVAADKELGAFVSADNDFEIEQKGSDTTATVKVKFKNRDADVILAFDSATARLKNMTVNGDYSRGEVLKKAGLNTLLGMGTVFVVLIIIALVISLFNFLPGVKESKPGKKEEKEVVKPALEQTVETARLVRQLDAHDLVHLDKIAGFGKDIPGLVRVGDDHAHDAVLGAVVGDRSPDIDVPVREQLGDLLHGALLVSRKYRNLFQHVLPSSCPDPSCAFSLSQDSASTGLGFAKRYLPREYGVIW